MLSAPEPGQSQMVGKFPEASNPFVRDLIARLTSTQSTSSRAARSAQLSAMVTTHVATVYSIFAVAMLHSNRLQCCKACVQAPTQVQSFGRPMCFVCCCVLADALTVPECSSNLCCRQSLERPRLISALKVQNNMACPLNLPCF